MEAMAMGKIVVSTLHSGIPELIQSGANGYLVPEKDPDSLTETMASALKSPDRWPDLAGRARQTVADQFQIRRQNSRLIRLFSEEPMKKKMPDGRLQAPPEAQ
jgi:colanic acid/amylovoran biosynthesis glycosyltransferase